MTTKVLRAWSRGFELRAVPGVESVAMSGFALMSGSGWDNGIKINGQLQNVFPYFLAVSAGFVDTMRIGWIDGRDFRPGEILPGAAIVNEAFAGQYFKGKNPVGKSFESWRGKDQLDPVRVVGYVRDARYRNMREPIRPTIYVPLERDWDFRTFEVRTVANPLSLATRLREEVSRIRSEFRVSSVQTQTELVEQHTIRERLLAMLSLFFAIVALVLAGVGLYGVLSYSVIQRTREIGIRMALGARPSNVVRRVTPEVVAMLVLGAFAGLATGVASERYVESLLFEVKATDVRILATPMLTLLVVALLAALIPTLRAVRIDPAKALRAE